MALAEAGTFVRRPDVAEPLKSRAIAVSGAISGDAFTAPPPSETSLRFIDQALGKLASAIDSADAAPTADARAAWATREPMAESAVANWNALRGEFPAAK